MGLFFIAFLCGFCKVHGLSYRKENMGPKLSHYGSLGLQTRIHENQIQ